MWSVGGSLGGGRGTFDVFSVIRNTGIVFISLAPISLASTQNLIKINNLNIEDLCEQEYKAF